MSEYTKRLIQQAAVEALEGRRFFSSVALSTAGVLTLQGDATTANNLTVAVDARGMVVATANGTSQSYSPSAVKSVRLIGGAADDRLVAAGVKVAVYADGGAGNDSIAGGAAGDTLLGGAGNDTIDGAEGNDLIRGGDGSDSLAGGDGNDSLFGEAGDDTLVGGAGANALDGGDGTNTLDGVTGVPTTTTPAGTAARLTGAGFGTGGSWNNTGNTFEKAIDGSTSTYYDAGQGDFATVGLDLGTAQVVTSARFFPRGGLAWRMVGGTFQGSNDNANWTTLGTLTAEPQEGTYSTLSFTGTTAYRYVRYVAPAGGWGNVAELEFYGTAPAVAVPAAPTTVTATAGGTSSVSVVWADASANETGFKVERSADGGATFTQVAAVAANVTTYTDTTVTAATTYVYRVRATNAAGDSAATLAAAVTTASPAAPPPATPGKLTGAGYGTAGSWNNSGNTYDKAIDGNANTYFDSTLGDGAVVGLDLGAPQVITSVRFMPRDNWSSRMVGGKFQGSNDNSTWTTLATITASPAQRQYTTLAVTDTGGYRYVRYVSPVDGWGNVAEVEFYGTPATATSGSSPGSVSPNTGDTVPAAPMSLAATTTTTTTTTAGAVTLAWADASSNETAFEIERSTAGGAFATLATVAANVLTYTDTTAVAGTTYAYRVRARGTAGASDYAAAATVTTASAVVVGAPQAVITLVENAVTAGMAVHANAIATTLNSGSPITARYEWDFGDPNGKYNTLTGFNASHVYDAAGTYTVTLKVTDDAGRSTTVTQTVTVAADARRVIYVDAVNGSDSNNGLSAATAVRSANYAFKLLGNNTKILFARGQTFGVTDSLLATYANITIGAYGAAGANPVLSWVGGTEQWREMISASATATRGLTIENLTLTSGNAGRPNGICPRGTNVTIRNCEFRNLSEAINCAGNPNGLLVQDNVQPQNAGVTDYFVWMQGTNISVLGNTVGGGGAMYAIRASGISGTYTGVLVFGNTFSNDQRSNLRMQKGSYVYVTGNTFNSTGVEFGPLGGGDGFNDPNYATVRTSYAVLENNVLNLSQQYIRLSNGAEHVMIRNNAITRTATSAGEAISIEGYDSSYGRQVSDVYILNNTIVDNDASGIAIKLVGAERGAQITIMNNLFVAPNLVAAASTGSADVWINDPTMGSIRLIANNIWSAPKYESYVGAGASTYVQGAGTYGFLTPAMWEAYTNVEGDIFQNVTLGSVYQITVNGVTAGANLPRP